jgi:SAM-dependent methyltransferase
MRVGVVANLLDKLILATGRVPTPILETFPTVLLARTVMAGVKLGLFEALTGGPLCADVIAERCHTDLTATTKLLDTLVRLQYVRVSGTRYALKPVAKHWLLAASPRSVRDYVLYMYVQWEWIARLEDYIRTGEPICFHQTMTAEDWQLYQRGMRSIARLTAPEVAWRIPAPRQATALLDIGGAHGYYSAALLRRHPALQADILDLPEAVAQAAPMLPETGMSARMRYRVGDALQTDFGQARYDIIFMGNLAHHFDAKTNRALAQRIAYALKPDGVFVIQEGVRAAGRKRRDQFAALGDLYFALSSEAGLYSYSEMKSWQLAAGLSPLRPRPLLTGPGQGLQIARKPPR